MIDRYVDTKRLKLAKVRYYDVSKGAEVIDLDAYAFLLKVGDNYINLFDPTEELPVFERTMYTNTTSDGEDYGNLIHHVSGEENNGPCYIIEKVDMADIFENRFVRTKEIERYILDSKNFFVDRVNIYNDKHSSARSNFMNRNKIKSDVEKLDELKEYISNHESAKKYIK